MNASVGVTVNIVVLMFRTGITCNVNVVKYFFRSTEITVRRNRPLPEVIYDAQCIVVRIEESESGV